MKAKLEVPSISADIASLGALPVETGDKFRIGLIYDGEPLVAERDPVYVLHGRPVLSRSLVDSRPREQPPGAEAILASLWDRT